MKVYILDSGGSSLNEILNWLSETSKVKEVALFKNPYEFLEKVRTSIPDLVFIRVGCSEIPGLKVGERVSMLDHNIKIIFVSSKKEFAVDAYEAGAHGYLLCPIKKKKFDRYLG